jgi:hypothetical protein
MAERPRSNPDVSVPESANDDASGRRPSAMNLGRVGSPRYAGPEPVRINSKKPSAMRLHEIGVRVPVADADVEDVESADLTGVGQGTDPDRARRLAGLIVGFVLVFAVAIAAVVFIPRGHRAAATAPTASTPAVAPEISAPSAPSTAPTPSTTASSPTAPTAALSAAAPSASSSTRSTAPSTDASHPRSAPATPPPSARKGSDGLIF